MRKGIIIGLIIFIGLYALLSGNAKKIITYINVWHQSNVSQIEHIESSKYGRPLTLVITKDNKGEPFAIWMNSISNYFKPTIEARVSLKNTLSSDSAKQIIEDNNLLNNIEYIQLSYYKNPNAVYTEGSLKDGAYWFVTNGDSINVYIDIRTGEYYVYNASIGEYAVE